jgi:hypothetical protein
VVINIQESHDLTSRLAHERSKSTTSNAPPHHTQGRYAERSTTTHTPPHKHVRITRLLTTLPYARRTRGTSLNRAQTNRSRQKGTDAVRRVQASKAHEAKNKVLLQCVGRVMRWMYMYLFLEAAGGVAVPAEATGRDEVGAEEGGFEVRRQRRVHERRGHLLLHGHPPGQARPLFR